MTLESFMIPAAHAQHHLPPPPPAPTQAANQYNMYPANTNPEQPYFLPTVQPVQQVSPQQDMISPLSTTTATATDHSNLSPINTNNAISPANYDNTTVMDNNNNNTTATANDEYDNFVLGSFRLSAHQANLLMAEFTQVYLPLCPILVFQRTPSRLYDQDPFLFWTIIAVALRRPARAPRSRPILAGLSHGAVCTELERIATGLTATVGQNYTTVIALLLLCEWPLPKGMLTEDLTFHFSSLALAIGYQAGLHRPFHASEYINVNIVHSQPIPDSELQERVLTWVMCYIIRSFIACDLGLPSMLQDDYIITSAAESHPSDRPAFLRGIPESIIQLLRVARYNETVARELGNALTPTGQLANDAAKPIISAHARKIDEMELAAQSLPASNPVFPQVLISRMRLYGYALQMTPAPDFGEKATIQSFTTATRLLNHCRSLSLDTIASWPRSTFFGFGLAVMALLRLLASENVHEYDLPVNEALTSVSHVYRLALEVSMRPDDQPAGFAKLLSFYAVHAKGRPRKVQGPHVSSRMGAPNFLYEAIKSVRMSETQAQQASSMTSRYQSPAGGAADALFNAEAELASVLSGPPELPAYTSADFDELLASLSNDTWNNLPLS